MAQIQVKRSHTSHSPTFCMEEINLVFEHGITGVGALDHGTYIAILFDNKEVDVQYARVDLTPDEAKQLIVDLQAGLLEAADETERVEAMREDVR